MRARFWLTVFLTCFINIAVFAQNNLCDDITRDTDVVKKSAIWTTPALNITIKVVMLNIPQVWVNFNVKHLSEFISDSDGLFIRFNDGKSLRYFGQMIAHKYISTREGYFYQTDKQLTTDEIQWFKNKKISKYQIAGIDVPVTNELATQIQAYMACITDNFKSLQ